MIADVPAAAPLLQRSSVDWGYTTQPEKHSCRSRPMGACNWARGKVMGGSSTINYMIYTRGNPRDYDEWAEEGNHGKTCLTTFISLSNFEVNKRLITRTTALISLNELKISKL